MKGTNAKPPVPITWQNFTMKIKIENKNQILNFCQIRDRTIITQSRNKRTFKKSDACSGEVKKKSNIWESELNRIHINYHLKGL